jgi:hypothetical protein
MDNQTKLREVFDIVYDPNLSTEDLRALFKKEAAKLQLS